MRIDTTIPGQQTQLLAEAVQEIWQGKLLHGPQHMEGETGDFHSSENTHSSHFHVPNPALTSHKTSEKYGEYPFTSFTSRWL